MFSLNKNNIAFNNFLGCSKLRYLFLLVTTDAYLSSCYRKI